MDLTAVLLQAESDPLLRRGNKEGLPVAWQAFPLLSASNMRSFTPILAKWPIPPMYEDQCGEPVPVGASRGDEFASSGGNTSADANAAG